MNIILLKDDTHIWMRIIHGLISNWSRSKGRKDSGVQNVTSGTRRLRPVGIVPT